MANWLKKLMLFRLLILVTRFKKTEYDVKIKDIEDKIVDHSVYITVYKFSAYIILYIFCI